MRRRRIQRARRFKQAFSLIEILVAVTLLSVITIGLLAMFYQTQKAFRIGTSQVDVLESGRAAMQLICRDLQQMHTSNIDDVTNFFARVDSGPLTMDLPGGGWRTNVFQDVSFLTREGDTWSGISYRVHHTNQGAGTLYRAIASTNVSMVITQANASGQRQRRTVSDLSASVCRIFPNDWTPDQPPVALGLPELRFDQVAAGVVHFRVFAYTETGVLYNSTNYVSGKGEVYHMRNFVPAYLDVELAILDPKGMKQVERRRDVQARDYVATQAYRTHLFRQRVHLTARQLEYDLYAGK
jgi:prepilin-type N-terminal cleavage/methylation domain-containing protein